MEQNGSGYVLDKVLVRNSAAFQIVVYPIGCMAEVTVGFSEPALMREVILYRRQRVHYSRPRGEPCYTHLAGAKN